MVNGYNHAGHTGSPLNLRFTQQHSSADRINTTSIVTKAAGKRNILIGNSIYVSVSLLMYSLLYCTLFNCIHTGIIS